MDKERTSKLIKKYMKGTSKTKREEENESKIKT